MASLQANSAPPASASIVANSFVIKYYNILHQSPQVVYRFYADNSQLLRAEAWPSTSADSVTTLGGIHEKIMSLDSSFTRAEIMTVDSQESLAGNVLVMVIGALYNAVGVKRNFVQTFVLAPQEKETKSYYVVNDMFRYLDGADKQSQSASQVDNGGELESPAARNAVSDEGLVQSEPCSPEHMPLETQDEVAVEDQSELSECAEVSGAGATDNISIELTAVPASKENDVQAPIEDPGEDAPKKSYASILRLPGSKNTSVHSERPSSSTPRLSQSATVASTSQSVQTASRLSNVAESPHDHTDERTALETEGDGRSVYVKNLPFEVTVMDLRREFSKFGQIRYGGVDLRQRVEVCFAFVHFSDPSSAQSAIKASPITVGGRPVYVAERKVPPFQGGRGRFMQGRGYQNDMMQGTGYQNDTMQGRGYQNDMMRGRGYYYGRGMGRGGSDMERDFSRGGRGGAQNRGGYPGGNYFSTNVPTSNYSYRLKDGNGFRPVRRGAENQVSRNGPYPRSGVAVAAA